ncbi:MULTISPECIES: flavin reductase family protein [unclassified Serratia (in: enterobacteria)]|uniref:flavin reductase family protein n=1 Tax=unclassified Serratia (in: enterobacteria) TaxID=2647522 RepID=UPI0004FF9579|nr:MULTISPECIES: flavin reductase family protein [unclassified Serratia (in: enterobacteria)]KFK95609.1 Asp/Glu/hydantoin racemase [Serratia sp. Ag2]KFL00377.1 Asp/Glu/hydantoin racemase [Serratia sp. Ag1]
MSSRTRYYYEPAEGHGLAHDPLNAIVGPRPIGWISSLSAAGQRNLAPYSFFNCFNYRPPIIGFASTGWKDSVANIVETGEFVWNLTTRPLAEAMNNSSAALPRGEDEFAFAGLTPAPGRRVKAELVAESPVNFECRLTQCIQLQNAVGGNIETWLVLGEVVAVHIDSTLLDEQGVYQTAAAQPVLRAGGPTAYYGISDQHRFDLVRPDVRKP